jgi:hypothetical protein
MSNTVEQIKAEYSQAWAIHEQTRSDYEEARATNPDVTPMNVWLAHKKARIEYKRACAAYETVDPSLRM